jgi:hypothetical protein
MCHRKPDCILCSTSWIRPRVISSTPRGCEHDSQPKIYSCFMLFSQPAVTKRKFRSPSRRSNVGNCYCWRRKSLTRSRCRAIPSAIRNPSDSTYASRLSAQPLILHYVSCEGGCHLRRVVVGQHTYIDRQRKGDVSESKAMFSWPGCPPRSDVISAILSSCMICCLVSGTFYVFR